MEYINTETAIFSGAKFPPLSFFYLTGEKFLKHNTAFVIAPLYENDVCGDIFPT